MRVDAGMMRGMGENGDSRRVRADLKAAGTRRVRHSHATGHGHERTDVERKSHMAQKKAAVVVEAALEAEALTKTEVLGP